MLREPYLDRFISTQLQHGDSSTSIFKIGAIVSVSKRSPCVGGRGIPRHPYMYPHPAARRARVTPKPQHPAPTNPNPRNSNPGPNPLTLKTPTPYTRAYMRSASGPGHEAARIMSRIRHASSLNDQICHSMMRVHMIVAKICISSTPHPTFSDYKHTHDWKDGDLHVHAADGDASPSGFSDARLTSTVALVTSIVAW